MDAASRVHHVAAGSGPCVTYPNNVINLKLTALESAGEMTVLEDVIPPQAGPPLHIHSRENEAYYRSRRPRNFRALASRYSASLPKCRDATGAFVDQFYACRHRSVLS